MSQRLTGVFKMARSKWLLWVLLVGAVLLLSGCFVLTVLDESDNGTVKSIKIGNTLLIRLAGNPTTGFVWERTDSLLEAVLEPLDEGVFIPDDENLVGAGGVWEFRFRTLTFGSTPIDFVYWRPWEEEIVDTFSVMIIVR